MTEISQIAGRAGRFKKDGYFGITGDCETLEPDEIERIAVAIDSIPTAKSILLTSMFKAGVVGPIGGAAGGGGKETKPTPPAPIELQHVGNEKLDEHIREISSEEQESALTRTFSEIFRN